VAVGELVVSIIGDMRELSKTFAQVQTEIDGIGKKFQSIGSALKDTGKTMSTYVTAPLVGIGAVSLHTAANFDDSMRKVQAVSGATGSDFEKLTKQARELGATTAFSASDAADAMYYLALAGWDVNEIMDATPGLLSLASAAGMDLGEAADIVSDTMSGFTMTADQAGRAADVFATITSSANTDVHQLGEAMKYASSTANAAGMDLEQTAAVLGVLADSGIKGSMAGTTFNAMLRDMRKNAVDGTIAIGRHTIALYNQDGTMRDLGSIMAEVEKATEGMTDKQRDAALSAIFQEESIRGVNIMLATGSERYQELEAKLRSSEGAAKDMADTMEGGVGGAIREMESALEELMIVLGNIIVVGVTPLIKYITDLANWFSKLPAPVQQTVVAIGAILAAIGPLLIIIGSVASAIGSLAALFGSEGALATAMTFISKSVIPALGSALGTLLSPVGLIAIAVAALALAWKNNWGDIQGKAKAVWDWLQSEMNKLVNRLEYYYHALVMAISAADLEDKWDRIKNRLEYYYHALVMGASGLYNDLKKYWGELSTALEPAKESLSSAWDSIKTIWETFKTSFLDSMSTLYEDVKKALEPLRDTLDELCQQLKEDIIPVVLDFLGSFSGSAMDDAQADIDSLTDIINFLSEKLREFFDWVARHPEITEFVATVAAMAVAIPVALGLLAAAIVLFVAKVVSLFIELVKAAYDLYTDWKDHFENLKTTVTQAIDNIIAKVRGWYTENVNKFNQIKSAALDLLNNWRTHWDNIKTTLTQAVSDIVTRLQGWYNDTQARFTQVKAAALDILNNWRTHWENFKTTLNLAVANIIAKLQSWYTDVQNRFNQVKAAALDFYNNWKARWDSIWKTLSDAKDYIINTAQMLYNDLLNQYNRIKAELSNLLTEWKARWNEIYTSVKTKATEIVDEVYGIVTKLKNKATEFYNAGKNLVQNLIDGINDKISSLRKKIDELTSMIADYLPMNSPSLKGALSKLPKWDDVVSSPVAKSLSSTVSAAKRAGSSIVSSIASGISSAAKTAYNAASSALKKIKSLLPHSPAEEGPFRVLPNWDAVFSDPIEASIKKIRSMSEDLRSALSVLRSPIDSSLLAGFNRITNVTNSTYIGDSITIGPNTLNSGLDLEAIFEVVSRMTAEKRRARGLYR